MAGYSQQQQHDSGKETDRSKMPTATQSTGKDAQLGPSKERSGLWGWLQNTGDSIANGYNKISDNVQQWTENVSNSAHEVMDVVRNTSLSQHDGVWKIQSDVDEILDIVDIPELMIDRESSENKIAMEVDRNTGIVTLNSPSIAIKSLHTGDIQIGPSVLQNVRISISNAKVNLPMLGEVSVAKGASKSKQSGNQNSVVTIQASSVVGSNIQYKTPSGMISAKQVELQNFSLSSTLSKEMFGKAPTNASFQVDKAVVSGLSTTDSGKPEKNFAGNLALQGTKASMNSADQSASFSSDSIHGTDIKQGANSVGSSTIQGVQGNISQNHQKNGHIASLSANSASMSSVDTSMLDAQKLQANALHTTYDSHSQQLATHIDGMDASGVELAMLQGRDVHTKGLNFSTDIDDNKVSTNIDDIRVSNFGVQDSKQNTVANAKDLHMQGLGFGLDDQHMDISAKQASAHAMHSLGASGNLSTTNLQTSLHKNNSDSYNDVSVQADAIRGNNLGYKDNSIQDAAIQNLAFHQNGNSSTGHIGTIEANGLANKYGSVGTIQSSNLQVQQAKDSLDLRADSIRAQQAQTSLVNNTRADDVSVNNIHVQEGANFASAQFQVGSVQANNLGNDFVNIEKASMQDVQGSRQNTDIQANVGSLEAENANVLGFGGLGKLTASGISGSATEQDMKARVAEVQAHNLHEDTFGGSVGQASVHDFVVQGSDKENIHSSLGKARVENAQLQGATIANADIQNGTAKFQKGNGDIHLGSANINNAAYLDQASLGNGHISDIHLHGNAEQQQGSVGSITAQDMSTNMPQLRSSAGSASLTGGKFTHTGDGKGSASVDKAHLSNIQFAAQDAKTTKKSFNDNATPALSTIDMQELLRTGSERIDSASIQANVGLHSGKVGSGMTEAKVPKNTSLKANIMVQNNQIQNGSSVRASNPLDSFAWTSVNGAYVKDNELKADVNGWFDSSVSEEMNKAMGIRGKKLQNIATYANAASKLPASNSSTDMNSIIDTNSLQASGHASLSDGAVRAGDAGLTLAGQKQGSNQIDFSATAQKLTMAFAQLLASSLYVQTSKGDVSAKSAAINGGNLDVQPAKGTAQGSIKSVEVANIAAKN